MSKISKNSVSSSASIAAKFWGVVRKSVVEKTLHGEPVKAIDVKTLSLKTGDVFGGKANRWSAAKCIVELQKIKNSLPSEVKFPEVYYVKNLKWTGENSFYDTFKAAWNKSKGSPTKCSIVLGNNEWWEPIMTAAACETKFDMWKEDDLDLHDKTGTVKSNGTQDRITDEETCQQIAEELAALFATEYECKHCHDMSPNENFCSVDCAANYAKTQ